MAGTDTYQIQIGEHSILGAFAHMSIRFINTDTGERIVEINGLATDRKPPMSSILAIRFRMISLDMFGMTNPNPSGIFPIPSQPTLSQPNR